MGDLTGHTISKAYRKDWGIWPIPPIVNGGIGQNPQYSRYTSIILYTVQSLIEIGRHKIWEKNVTNYPKYPKEIKCQVKIIVNIG